MNTQKENRVINPFSERFLETWELYKVYRKETHNFIFLGLISEQMLLKKLVEVSGGDEIRAIRIVEQTIASGKWSGFYPLKTTTYKENGKSNSKPGKKEPPSIREQVVNELNDRNAKREQSSGSDYLKAV